jgi:hypothetical protein
MHVGIVSQPYQIAKPVSEKQIMSTAIETQSASPPIGVFL